MPDENTPRGKTGSEGPAPNDKGGSTQQVTISKGELDRLKQEASASAGRSRKISELENTVTRIKGQNDALTTRLDDLERRRDEERYEQVKDDPVKLKQYRDEQDRKNKDRTTNDELEDLRRKNAELEADNKKLKESQGETAVATVAAKYGLKPETLEDLGVTDPDQLDKIASRMKPDADTGDGGGGDDKGNGDWNPDDHGGTPSGGEPTNEQFDKMSEEQMADYFDKHKDD